MPISGSLIPSLTVLRKGIFEILPNIIEAEKQAFIRGGGSGSLLLRDQRFSQSKQLKETITALLDGIAYVFSFIEPVNAAWVRGDGCYKDDDPFYLVPGYNLAAFCCNCGWSFSSAGYTFVPDCGVQSLQCSIPMGCLNFTCSSWPNARWYETTGICGCG